jgi:hypothetical protein
MLLGVSLVPLCDYVTKTHILATKPWRDVCCAGGSSSNSDANHFSHRLVLRCSTATAQRLRILIEDLLSREDRVTNVCTQGPSYTRQLAILVDIASRMKWVCGSTRARGWSVYAKGLHAQVLVLLVWLTA